MSTPPPPHLPACLLASLSQEPLCDKTPVGAHLIHPDVPLPRSLNLSASGSLCLRPAPSPPHGIEQHVRCSGAGQFPLPLFYVNRHPCAKCELCCCPPPHPAPTGPLVGSWSLSMSLRVCLPTVW